MTTTAFCGKCKKVQNMVEEYETELKNKKKAIKGKCELCGTNMCRMGGSK